MTRPRDRLVKAVWGSLSSHMTVLDDADVAGIPVDSRDGSAVRPRLFPVHRSSILHQRLESLIQRQLRINQHLPVVVIHPHEVIQVQSKSPQHTAKGFPCVPHRRSAPIQPA